MGRGGDGDKVRGPDREGSGKTQKSLLYVSTLDHIIRVMLPHLDAARARGWRVEVACQVTRFRPNWKRTPMPFTTCQCAVFPSIREHRRTDAADAADSA